MSYHRVQREETAVILSKLKHVIGGSPLPTGLARELVTARAEFENAVTRGNPDQGSEDRLSEWAYDSWPSRASRYLAAFLRHKAVDEHRLVPLLDGGFRVSDLLAQRAARNHFYRAVD